MNRVRGTGVILPKECTSYIKLYKNLDVTENRNQKMYTIVG
jgi:hypothetical protein